MDTEKVTYLEILHTITRKKYKMLSVNNKSKTDIIAEETFLGNYLRVKILISTCILLISLEITCNVKYSVITFLTVKKLFYFIQCDYLISLASQAMNI